jgi:hypothetical protein
MLGLPMLLLYVFGLPLVAYFFVYRLRKRAIKVVFEKKSSSNNNLAVSTTRPRQNSSTGTRTNRRLNRESMQDDGQFKVLGFQCFSRRYLVLGNYHLLAQSSAGRHWCLWWPNG